MTRTKQAQWSRKHYLLHRSQKLKDNKQRKSDIRVWFNSYRALQACKVCNESHPACLDFHHKERHTKLFEVTYMVHRGFGKDAILKEIEKCEVLCANCHRKFHVGD